MFYIPILGALALASGTIMQKMILKKRRVSVQTYISAEFLAIILAMLPFIYFFWKLEPGAFQTSSIAILFLIVFFSVIANIFNVYSMKWEKVTKLEPAKMLEPLFTVLLAIVFSFVFGAVLFERNFQVIIPAIIAGAALIFSHIRKHHLDFNKYFISQILASFFFALELVMAKLILEYYSPISFYFTRSLFVFIASFLIFRPRLDLLNKKTKYHMLLIGFVWALYRVVVYYGYLELGIIFTTLIIMLGPIFIYFLAWKFLHEKLHWKNTAAATIIILCILYVMIF
ncbi:MAG: EamA family transporter [Candidatus Pacearchaeota archaeon]|jgi:drug/metabolite transporter (DMT)-like permease